ncbi:glycosyltransferase family 2 protein [Flavobacterium sp. RSP15]|uniref:glycosyltransferase family 2 protein n=1 Tax=Flavobacterium sp. RSP15 TaxID=2497485 RepID=UPI000F82EFCD|nr:glycosyltransferase [Flavobacterium sp. RSP15]RTY85566.1 glycosyltransferase [Flavobacterium sp. RSP15]
MQTSILIVSKNRKSELEYTLNILAQIIDFSENEVLVFLDGCIDNSKILKEKFCWVGWFSSEKSIGASAARHQLYPKAKGQFLIGFDDDAHPLQSDFITRTLSVFERYPIVGIVAFQEIKGVFGSDQEALSQVNSIAEEYFTNEFIGCGFAIRKEAYQATNGFPVWIDIYGEESCVAIEVLSKGFDIMYSNKIKVNHRVDREERKLMGQNYFRFGKQLKNTTYYYLVYYPFPVVKILKLYWHNFIKYALSDIKCFKIFFNVIFEVLLNIRKILKYRKPISETIINKIQYLLALKY